MRDNEDHSLRNTLMLAGAATPFLGMWGEQPYRSEKRWDAGSYKKLMRHARPGDLVMSGEPSLGQAKASVGLASGNPHGYHIAVVGRDGKLLESHRAKGFGRPVDLKDYPSYNTQLIRPKLSGSERDRYLQQIHHMHRGAQKYERAVYKELRKNYGRNASRKGADAARSGLFNRNEALSAGARNLVMPKVRDGASVKEELEYLRRARRDFARGDYKHYAARAAGRYDALRRSGVTSFNEKHFQDITGCVGGVCSTSVAGALGKKMLPGKGPRDIVPADFLRSTKFKTVGRHHPNGSEWYDRALKYGPTLSRAGLGAALAGGVYFGSKLLGD